MPLTLAAVAANTAQRRALAEARARLVAPLIAEIREGGAASLAEIARKLNERGSATDRGNAWTATTVRRVLLRLEGF